MYSLKVRRVGNSLGFTLPAQAAHDLQVREGDVVYLTRSPDGFRLTPFDPDFEDAMKLAKGVMNRYRNTLRELGR